MQKVIFYWRLHTDIECNSIFRYCHNCGKRTVFTDTKKRRHNANGKNIYAYAIYKCEKDHTWNLKLRNHDTINFTEENESTKGSDLEYGFCFLNLQELKNEGVSEINIILEEVTGKWRVDKLLAEKIEDLSRERVCKWLEDGMIIIDGKKVNKSKALKKLQMICIRLNEIK